MIQWVKVPHTVVQPVVIWVGHKFICCIVGICWVCRVFLQLKWKLPDEEGLVKFLAGEKGFA